MGIGSEGRAAPLFQQGVAMSRRGLDCGREPLVESARAFGGLRLEIAAKVVKAHAAADDEHAFIAEGSESAAGGNVHCGIERVVQGERDDWYLRFREGDFEGIEDSVVVTAPGGSG